MKLITLIRIAALIASTSNMAIEKQISTNSTYIPTQSNLKARELFQDAKYGLFIHWGIYSLLADGEWVMENKKIALNEYKKLADNFNPTQFDPIKWVALAKAAGMKYIVITSKHHDGFAMFKSQASRWNIVDSTPYQKDIIKLLADECRKEGIKLFFYYSQLDWHHSDFFPRGKTGHRTKRPNAGDWKNYIRFMNQQLSELLTNYGDVGGMWFDGLWDRPDADWQLEETYKHIHDLQPQVLIGSNHHLQVFPGEDFQMFEKDLPGNNESGFNEQQLIGNLPLETCETINDSWGFSVTDTKYKSVKTIIHYLARAAGNGANLLLNIGPMPNGEIQMEFIERLREVGQWLSKYGEAIYNTRKGPISPRGWGVTTSKDDTIYIHLLSWEMSDHLYLPLTDHIASAYYLIDENQVEYEKYDKGIIIKNIPSCAIDVYDTVIVLKLAPEHFRLPVEPLLL